MNPRQYLLAVCLMVLGLTLATPALAATSVPYAPQELTPGLSSTFNTSQYPPRSVEASAGNITALVIYGIGQTKAWQGFYGNISGTITLDDAENYTFYNWSAAEPRGQVYATLNNSVTWETVECLNYTGPGLNESTMQEFYGIQPNASDDISITFNETNHVTFQVGWRNITGCPTTYIFQNDTIQGENFVNVLLWDVANNATGWIYTTLIENKDWNTVDEKVCYNGQDCDFQILVNENGFGTDVDTTTYYFWVELI